MDDSQIITMLFARNDKALGLVADKYGSLLYRLSDNILHCREDATECVNDTYLAVWNNIPPHSPNPPSNKALMPVSLQKILTVFSIPLTGKAV